MTVEVRRSKEILAVVTRLDRDRVADGVPVFYVENEEEQREVAFWLSRLLDAVPHDLENGTFIMVRHR